MIENQQKDLEQIDEVVNSQTSNLPVPRPSLAKLLGKSEQHLSSEF